ncbi:superoxide dismutase family protein [uncultured Sulfitobacter sp.]|uniref:superoxide dismutase family protein n=1 Tax=uncultured Sulfitobacter sp. TaxID=191468 RepID=UPI002639297C|nr:superoxide dismutase family protein [uncultured Sulfitobacter sp.]
MKTLTAAILVAGLAAPALQAAEVSADVTDRDGNRLGAVRVHDTPSGVAVATLTLNSVPAGIHAVHLHETGDCSASDFKSAGGHVAGDRAHGVMTEDGPHPGDMPNLTVKSDGVGEVEVFLPFLNVSEHLLDEDGAAFVIHEGVDDYESQPAGDAGERIACGELTERTQ